MNLPDLERKRLEGLVASAGFEDAAESVADFWSAIGEENAVQNLTRLTTVEQFMEGHFEDCRELLASGWISESANANHGPILDIGSGAGVPGLLTALLEPSTQWILSDSEKSKADFLGRVISALDLGDRVAATGERCENVLKEHPEVETLTARAVGPVLRIYRWIERCSTWNTLILFKGPSWDDEWKEFQRSNCKNKLELVEARRYRVGDKDRRLILLKRSVPRGTST